MIEDSESKPHKLVTSQVERDKDCQELRELKMPNASPGFSGGKLPGRSKAEGGPEEQKEEEEVRKVEHEAPRKPARTGKPPSDKGNNPLELTNLFAVAQELVRKTHVHLGHPTNVQFLGVLRVGGARLEVPAYDRHQLQCAVCTSMSRLTSHRREAIAPF